MMPQIPDDLIDWAAVRKAYETSSLTVPDILESFALSKSRLYRRAKREGWISRSQADWPSPPEATITEKRAALAARLFHALEDRILALEEETADHDTAHGERDAKALTALARALDQLTDMLEASDAAPADTPSPFDTETNVDDFRNLLTDRLDRLRDAGRDG